MKGDELLSVLIFEEEELLELGNLVFEHLLFYLVVLSYFSDYFIRLFLQSLLQPSVFVAGLVFGLAQLLQSLNSFALKLKEEPGVFCLNVLGETLLLAEFVVFVL